MLVDLELAAQLGVFLVVVHDSVGEEVAVPVGYHAKPLASGHGDHLVNDPTTQFVGHDIEGVVDTNNQRLPVFFGVSRLFPPFLKLEGVRDDELTRFMGVLFLAKVDEFLVDVDTDAGNGNHSRSSLLRSLDVGHGDGGSKSLLGIHLSDDVAGSASDFQNDIVSTFLCRLSQSVDRRLVGRTKDRVFVGHRFVPRHGGHELPDLTFGVIRNAGGDLTQSVFLVITDDFSNILGRVLGIDCSASEVAHVWLLLLL
mmetsp:Transcript_6873/g.16752  ORF Transcript_6873/g.16752 Transcript_6873/m.16752 type:complete len:255 (-) Transcript_6873:97-861(-)